MLLTVRHHFEAAHRLPQLGGKCANLHGHSWRVAWTVEAPPINADGIAVDLSTLKDRLRSWIDSTLDHGVMLGHADPLADVIEAEGCRLQRVSPWPTVECVAALIGFVMHTDAAPTHSVLLAETETNEVLWTP